MSRLTRRAYVTAIAGALTATAGCLSSDSPEDPSGTDNSNTDTGNTSTPTPTPEPDPVVDIETIDGPTEQTIPDWNEDVTTDPGAVAVYTSSDAADAVDADEMSTVAYEIIQEIIAETDFATETLIHVESVAPTVCYTQTVNDISVTDGQITGDVTVSEDNNENTGCAEMIQYPSTFIRLTFEGTPARNVQLTVTNGWGAEATLPPGHENTDWGTPETNATETPE